jgi:hypothetical protein
MTEDKMADARGDWAVDPHTASVRHLPSGMVIRFTADADEPGALDGQPDAMSPALLRRLTEKEGAAGLAWRMREAGEVYGDYLRRRRQ